MDRAQFESRLVELLGHQYVRANAPLAPLTTFRVGGPAEWLVDVVDEERLVGLVRYAREARVALRVLGGGSNVLVSDRGVDGLVVRLKMTNVAVISEGAVRADAGVTINGLVRWTIARGLAGLEAWAGTPGTVGGAVCGNAHWAGRNVSDLLQTVRLVTREAEVVTARADEMGFAYDTSRVQTSGEIVVAADFAIAPGDATSLRARARESLAYRKHTQPLAMASAGCIFRNPDPARDPVPAGIPASAGALIDRAGLKGRSIGGARISDRHGNFIVNDGRATASDIRALIDEARTEVETRFGVALRDEVVFLGNF